MVGIVRAECTDLLAYMLRHSRRRNVRQDLSLFPLLSFVYAEHVQVMKGRAGFMMEERHQEAKCHKELIANS